MCHHRQASSRRHCGATSHTSPDSSQIRAERCHFTVRYRSAAHLVDVFRDYYGPTHKAFAALDTAGRTALEHDLLALLSELNVAGPASLVVPSEYLQVVITKA